MDISALAFLCVYPMVDVSSYSMDELGDLLLEYDIHPDVATMFCGELLCSSAMFVGLSLHFALCLCFQ